MLLRRRPPEGLLGGMTELPGTDWRADPWVAAEALRLAPMPADWQPAGQVRHGFTHFELTLDLFAARVARIDAARLRTPDRGAGAGGAAIGHAQVRAYGVRRAVWLTYVVIHLKRVQSLYRPLVMAGDL